MMCPNGGFSRQGQLNKVCQNKQRGGKQVKQRQCFLCSDIFMWVTVLCLCCDCAVTVLRLLRHLHVGLFPTTPDAYARGWEGAHWGVYWWCIGVPATREKRHSGRAIHGVK